jgi:hypothetical protein
LEIVVCSGYGKNGALSVLQVCGDREGASWWEPDWADLPPQSTFQKSIRPQVVTTFELPGCYDMWTVIAPVRKEEVGKTGLRRPRGGQVTDCRRAWGQQGLSNPTLTFALTRPWL